MAHDIVYLVNVPWALVKMYILLSLGNVFYLCLFYSVDKLLFICSILLIIFYLLVLSVAERQVLKFETTVVDLLIFLLALLVFALCI